MKKFIYVLVLLLSVSMASYSQDTKTDKDVAQSEAERLVDKYGGALVDGSADFADKVGVVLTTMAEKLEKPVEDVFNIFVFYYTAKGFTNLMCIPLFLLFFPLFLIYIKKADFDGCEWNRYATMTLIFGIASLGFFITTLACLPHAILYITAPEYFVIQDIFDLVKEVFGAGDTTIVTGG